MDCRLNTMINKIKQLLDGFKQLFYIDDRTDQELSEYYEATGFWSTKKWIQEELKKDVWESNPTKKGGYSNKIYPYRTKKQYDGRYYYSDKLENNYD